MGEPSEPKDDKRDVLSDYRAALKATILDLESISEAMERALRRARDRLERLEIDLEDGD